MASFISNGFEVKAMTETLVGQFLATSGPHARPAGWREWKLNAWQLSSHPTLKVVNIVDAQSKPIGWLLGEPWLDSHLVNDSFSIPLSNGHLEPSLVEESLFSLGGSWVALLVNTNNPMVFSDAFAHLSVVYSETAGAVSSNPFLIPSGTGMGLDDGMMNLMHIPEEDNWYPFGFTCRRNVTRLLPNHYLDLQTWNPVRHWPLATESSLLSVDEAAETLASATHSCIGALSAEYPIQMSLTAGVDSRMILACARNHIQSMQFVTNNSHPATAGIDIHVARHFAHRYNLDHVVRQPRIASSREQEIWLQQTGRAGAGAAFRHLCLTNAYGTERARLSGQGGEVIRAFFYKSKPPKKSSSDYTPQDIADLLGTPQHNAITDAADTWLSGLPDCDGETLLDLLYLEQRMGCWAGPLRYGGNSSHRVFWPVAHRKVLDQMLRLPTDAKRGSQVHIRVIEREWPQLLELPFNEWYGWRRHWRKWSRQLRRFTPARVARAAARRLTLTE